PMFATSRRSLPAARSTPPASSRISSLLSRPPATDNVAAVPWIVVIGVNSSCARICTSSVFIRFSSPSSVLSRRSGQRSPELLHDLPGHLGRQVALAADAPVHRGDDLVRSRPLDDVADRARADHLHDRGMIE